MGTSNGQGSSTFGNASDRAAEPLDIERLPSATGAAAEALGREEPGGVPFEEYFLFLKRLGVTEEQLRAIPCSAGPRFTLD